MMFPARRKANRESAGCGLRMTRFCRSRLVDVIATKTIPSTASSAESSMTRSTWAVSYSREYTLHRLMSRCLVKDAFEVVIQLPKSSSSFSRLGIEITVRKLKSTILFCVSPRHCVFKFFDGVMVVSAIVVGVLVVGVTAVLRHLHIAGGSCGGR